MSDVEIDDRGVIVACPACGKHNRVLFGRLSDAVRCGQCKAELGAPAAPVEISGAADFDRVVSQASVPVVVDYWAPWCSGMASAPSRRSPFLPRAASWRAAPARAPPPRSRRSSTRPSAGYPEPFDVGMAVGFDQ